MRTNALASTPSLNLARTISIALSALGIVDAAYLTWTKLAHREAAFCTQGGNCDIVQGSAWAAIGSIPISVFGLLGYLFILVILLLDNRLGDWGPIVVLGATLIGTLYSAYLTYIELFVLHAICPYCVASAVLMLGLFVTAIYRFNLTLQDSAS